MSDQEKIPFKPLEDTIEDLQINNDLYESRKKIYVRLVKGVFRNIRFFGGLFLFVLYFGTAWLNWGGEQLVLFDLPARQFRIFNYTFWPQDFVLLSWALIIAAFGLFFITVFAGRVWCGYTCPQSVWTFLYIWIEEKTEGQRNARIKLDQQANSSQKALKKAAKHLGWLLVALVTALTFVGYFTPIRELVPNFLTAKVGGWALFWVLFFTIATYVNAGWMREQVCLYMCPYARFQSVMFDKDTLIVSYDEARGEPRGKRGRKTDTTQQGLGDCIDCNLCVQVCPTGIDIRDGLQYECITCAACIDACDSVMEKMNYPKGLIRYTTEHALNGNPTRILRPRLIGYAIALVVMISAFAYVLSQRVPAELNIIRDRGSLYNVTNEGKIRNSYRLAVLNMDQKAHEFEITVQGPDGLEMVGPQRILLQKGQSSSVPIDLLMSRESISYSSFDISFSIQATDDAHLMDQEDSRFFAPSKINP